MPLYCAIQAPQDAWWTSARLELVNSAVSREFIEPELKKLERSLKKPLSQAREV